MKNYKIGQLVEFGYYNGSTTTKLQGRILIIDNMFSGYEYDIMDEKAKILYKHIPEKNIYAVIDDIKDYENENSQFYCLSLDDFSAPSFCSFDKYYFGNISMVASLIYSLETDERFTENFSQLISAFKEYCNGNTKITHNVAYREIPLLEPVYIYEKIKIKDNLNKIEHLNTWDCTYYMRWKEVESEHIWLRYENCYIRCIKATFTNLEYASSDIEDRYRKIEFSAGFPKMINFYNETVSNKLYVAEKYFENEDEMLCDIKKFKKSPNPIYTEIFNDIFGDG